MRFAFYGRVSTEDAQDPAASRAWQLRRANDIISSVSGEVVAEYFDLGQSRSLPWKRRPEASRLLADLAQPRPWDAIVIGEPARAFYGSQFSLTFPVLTHYRVALWVPEVGGPVDPGSEAHDLVMTLFGGLSKGERSRIQVRVRSAMEAMAAEGDRFLGGRPPYGYRLIDAGPHPNPSKAAAGQRLHQLAPDPVTVPVVRRIFAMYAEGAGLRLIADTLTQEDIPSPAAYDPARNSHRDPRGWSHAAIRAILTNPIYGGRRVWGKQRRHEELLDVQDVAAGHVTRLRWKPEDQWIEAERTTVEAIIDPEVSAAVSCRFGSAPRRTRRRDSAHPYLLRGLLYCGVCGRKLQGSARPSRVAGRPPRILYRCEFPAHRSLPSDQQHPPTVYVREDAILPKLDAWLAEIVTPEALAAAQEPPAGTLSAESATRAAIADCDLRISRLLASVESGIGHDLVAPRVIKLRNERDRLEATLSDRSAWRPLSAGEIRALADALGGLVKALEQASPADRAAVYRELDLKLSYEPISNQVKALVELARVGRGVGGGTRSPGPRPIVLPGGWIELRRAG